MRVSFQLERVRFTQRSESLRPGVIPGQLLVRRFCISLTSSKGSGYQCFLDTRGQEGDSSVSAISVPGRSSVPAKMVQRRSRDSSKVYRSTVVHHLVTQVQETQKVNKVALPSSRYVAGLRDTFHLFTLQASSEDILKLGLSRKFFQTVQLSLL